MNTCGMMWMRMPGQTWLGATATFVAMWVVMMVPMMLPSLVPMLRRYPRGGLAKLVAALGYFGFWAAAGIVIFPLGVTLATIEIPLASGVVVLIAGAFQFTNWKARSLTCCRNAPHAGASAWRHGLRLGVECARCCGNLMLILLVLGVMDLGVMVAVTAAISVERLAPAGQRVARATGAVIVAVGFVLVVRG